jgi:hypothetical protein
MHFEQQGHERLFNLARKSAAIVQKVALDQLLSERGTALFDLSGTHVHDRRTYNRHEVHPMVGIELTIFSDFQRRRQQLRYISGGYHHAIFAMQRKDAADE